MKLSTRLSIVVGLIVTLLSISIGSFAIIYSQSSEIKSIKSVLNASTQETLNSSEDKFTVAINVSESSPIPLSAILVTGALKISYLTENSGSISKKPSLVQLRKAATSAVQVEHSFLIRSIRTSVNQFLIYSVSIKAVQDHASELRRSLFIFIFFSLIVLISLTYYLFRRDSRINEIARKLQENNERMQEFLGDASHELRTPLTVLRGYVELISNDLQNPDIPRYIQTMKIESERMAKLISDLLALAEIGEDEPVENERYDVDQLIKNKISELQDLNPYRRISYSSSPCFVETDVSLLNTVLSNVFSNIHRHTPSDAAVSVEVSAIGKGAVIVIEDGGPGLNSIPTKAFTRFDKARSREHGGSGLGMSLMQKAGEKIGAISFQKSALGGLKIVLKI
ncbi:MAG: histidine kinase dimerization/phospho-acceptor domain-containing protein [Actinomycetes bacterium]